MDDKFTLDYMFCTTAAATGRSCGEMSGTLPAKVYFGLRVGVRVDFN